MKCSGTFIEGLFARTAELNSDVGSKSFSTNSKTVFTSKLQERGSRKNSRNKNLMSYAQSN